MPTTPPAQLIQILHNIIYNLLKENPAATASEAYLQNYIEFELIKKPIVPRYFLRIGINYHGQKVQHIHVDATTGILKGWNPDGNALGTGASAKFLLAGYTIFDRDSTEPMMSDTKIGGGNITPGQYVRIEFKARGWLGKTKNLDGKQLEKDINLLKADNADLLVICLSETAHRKWRGEGPDHQVERRTGITRFQQILTPVNILSNEDILERSIVFEGQNWMVSSRRVIGAPSSIMPRAEHFITFCWRH